MSASSSRPSSAAAAPAANGAFAGSTTLATPRIAASNLTASASPCENDETAESPAATTEINLTMISKATAIRGAE